MDKEGQIIKIISNDYFVSYKKDIYICKSRGIFKYDNITPKVGDYVIFNIKEKIITNIKKRKNNLERPQVANIDQAFIVTSLKKPAFDTNLLDKLLVITMINNIEPVICLTKKDLLNKDEKNEIKKIVSYYKRLGIRVVYNTNLLIIKRLIRNKTTVFTGQTGAGKSSLINKLDKNLNFETNEISDALGRGKHTTRVVTLIDMHHGKVLDTPGFSSIDLSKYTDNEIKDSFVEFKHYPCTYKDCNHIKEKDCNVKKMVENKKILLTRYENYKKFIEKR